MSLGGVEQIHHPMQRQGLSVLGVGKEAMIGATEGELSQANAWLGYHRDGGPQVLNIERGAGNGYSEAGCLLNLFSQS